MIEKAIINTEKFREIFYQEIDSDVRDSILIISWHLELLNKRIRTLNRKKPLKGMKGVRKDNNSINGSIIWKYFIITM